MRVTNFDLTMRKIPATMASQHPDHASKPYWHNTEFIGVQEEARECFLSFSDLGISEYKWDWEGKLVDESILERLLGEHLGFFQKHPLGIDKFITFRLPNSGTETEFRMSRALMGVLSAAGMAKQVGLHCPPIFEVILPMVKSAEEMIDIEEAFAELANLKHRLFKLTNCAPHHLEVIPLFENIDTIINSDKIIKRYLDLHQTKFKKTPNYIRPYIARSDPALNSGMIPTVIAIKIALAKYKKCAAENNIGLYPILGAASLPFRGGLTPYNTEDFIHEYSGIKTVLLQSAFRYDFPLADVIKSIKIFENTLQTREAADVTNENEIKLISLIKIFENFYKPTVEGMADFISQIAQSVPKRRERVQHVGLFGYSRTVGSAKLPRAIGFTAAFYSLGVPPEIIGTGRGIAAAKIDGSLPLIEQYYLNLKNDMARAGKFVNKKNLQKLAAKNKAWNDVLEDVRALEEYLQAELAPISDEEKQHQTLTEEILNRLEKNESIFDTVQSAGILRKSLG